MGLGLCKDGLGFTIRWVLGLIEGGRFRAGKARVGARTSVAVQGLGFSDGS